MREPEVIAESLPYISRNALVKLSRPRFETIREAATQLWTACRQLKLPVQTYAAAAQYLQRFLMLNPSTLAELEKSLDTTRPNGQDQNHHHGQNNNNNNSNNNDDGNGYDDFRSLGLREVSCACLITAFLTEGPAKKIDDAAAALHVAPARVIALQREVLETNAFDFRVQNVPVWVVKHAKVHSLDQETAYLAYLIAIDSYETTAVIQFPAHQVAVACIDIALRERNPSETAKPQLPWDMNKFGLKIVAVRTSTRLLLEFYDRCSRTNCKTHASVCGNPQLRRWLTSLQKSAPALEANVQTPMVHDPKISQEGTARYRTRQDA